MSRHRLLARWLAAAALASVGASPAPAQGQRTPAAEQVPTSSGVARLLAELGEREGELDRREQELAERERSISELEGQVEKRLAELEQMRSEIEARIAAWDAKGGDRVARLAKVYAAMPPAKAAPLLQELELDLATSIVARMRDKTSAAILAEMPRSRALLLSRRLARPLASPARAAR